MISCYQFKELISEYLDGEISYSTRKLFEEHLESCANCRRLFNSVKTSIQSLHRLPRVHVSENFYLNLRNRIVEERDRIVKRARSRRLTFAGVPSLAYGLLLAVVAVSVFFVVMKIQGKKTGGYELPPYVKQQIIGSGSEKSLRNASFDRRVAQPGRPVNENSFTPDNRFLQIDTSDLYLKEADKSFDRETRPIKHIK